MLKDKRMTLVKSENEINYWLFKPSIFSLYYDDKSAEYEPELNYRKSLTHKMHMLWYLVFGGGYRILYLEQKDEILSYIAFVKANKRILKDCGAKDYYTIFLWTYPEHRGKGLATLMAKTMLNELPLDYKHFYKTILDDNTSSIRVAEKSGFHFECDTIKTGKLHTIQRLTSMSKMSAPPIDSIKYRLYVYDR